MLLFKFIANQNKINGLKYSHEIHYEDGLIIKMINYNLLFQECIYYESSLIKRKGIYSHNRTYGRETYYYADGIISAIINW